MSSTEQDSPIITDEVTTTIDTSTTPTTTTTTTTTTHVDDDSNQPDNDAATTPVDDDPTDNNDGDDEDIEFDEDDEDGEDDDTTATNTTPSNPPPAPIIDRTSTKGIILQDYDFTIPPQHIDPDSSTPEKDRKIKDPQDTTSCTVADIPRLVAELRDPDQNVAHHAIFSLRKLLSVSAGSPIDIIHSTPGASQSVIWLLQSNDISIKYEALWALTNLFSGERWVTDQLIELNALEPLVSLTTTEHSNLLDQVLWCLGNIAGDARDVLYAPQYFTPIFEVVERSLTTTLSTNVCKTLVWLVSNLVRGKPSPPVDQAQLFVPYIVTNFIQPNQDHDILLDCIWALTYLTDHTTESSYFVELLLTNYNLARHFIDLLQSSDNTIVTPALRAAGNCVASPKSTHTQVLLHEGLLDSLVRIISTNPKVGIQKEAAWTMSNIAAGTIDQIEYLAESKAFVTLTALIPNVQPGVLKEIIYVGANVLSGIKNTPIEEKVIRNLLSSNWFKQLAKIRLDRSLHSLFFEMIRDVLTYGEKHKVLLPFEGKKQEVNLSAFILRRDGVLRILLDLYHSADIEPARIVEEFFPEELEDDDDDDDIQLSQQLVPTPEDASFDF